MKDQFTDFDKKFPASNGYSRVCQGKEGSEQRAIFISALIEILFIKYMEDLDIQMTIESTESVSDVIENKIAYKYTCNPYDLYVKRDKSERIKIAYLRLDVPKKGLPYGFELVKLYDLYFPNHFEVENLMSKEYHYYSINHEDMLQEVVRTTSTLKTIEYANKKNPKFNVSKIGSKEELNKIIQELKDQMNELKRKLKIYKKGK